MRTVCLVLLAGLGSGLRSRATLQVENAALRHQLAVLQRQARGRPQLRVLAPLSVGNVMLRRYGAVSYSPNSACDLCCVPNVA